jgi:hypothetical protein
MRRYLLILFLPALVFCGILVPASIYYEPIDGDLTRTGRWAERDFGWNAAQPVVPIGLMSGARPAYMAAQLGHSLEVFYRDYAEWITGQDDDRELEKIEAQIDQTIPKLTLGTG